MNSASLGVRVLIFSDIHANLDALKSMLQLERFDEAIFLGDIVDYGPSPAETLDLLMENVNIGVMGNHDYAAITGEDCRCSPEMHDLSEYSRREITLKQLSGNDLKLLGSFPESKEVNIEGRNLLLAHASPNNHLFGYLFATEAEMVWKDQRFKKYDYILVGHTHSPMLYRGKIINPGSAGQPRDGNWMPMYTLWDTESGDFIYKRFRYNNEQTWEKLKQLIPQDSPYLQQLRRFYF